MKNILFYFILVAIVLAGCANNDSSMGEHEKIADQLDPTGDEGTFGDPEYQDSELNKRLGYVNYTKDQFEQDSQQNQTMTMDRKQIADMIARVIMQHEGYNEIAALVTGEEVLIAYEKNDELSDEEAADIAEKTAASMVPRFFEIYVSDNDQLIPDIQSLHNSTTTHPNYDKTLRQIIQKMQTN